MDTGTGTGLGDENGLQIVILELIFQTMDTFVSVFFSILPVVMGDIIGSIWSQILAAIGV